MAMRTIHGTSPDEAELIEKLENERQEINRVIQALPEHGITQEAILQQWVSRQSYHYPQVGP